MMSSLPKLPSWAVPDEVRSKWPAPMLKQSESGKEVMKVNEGPARFEFTLDVSHYLPEELKVTVSDNVLSVEGRHEAKEASGPNSSTSVRQFSRKWTLPPDCR